jgi:hypothetical protein
LITKITVVMFWIILGAAGVWWAAIESHEPTYITYPDCKTMALDYPNGIASKWVPQVAKNTVLGKHGNFWRAERVSLISESAYWSQHQWFDGDGDGIMCERLVEPVNVEPKS